MNYRSFNCPHCGKELQVPDDAKQIVCMFCAKPIKLDPPDNESVVFGKSVRLLPEGVFSARIQMDKLNAKTYPDIFNAYSEELQPALQAYLNEAEAYGEKAAELFSDALLHGFEQKEQSVGSSSAKAFDLRISITALTIPAILNLKTPAADHLVDLFLKKWNASHKQPLGKADYATILNGFRKRLCFVTTAVCTQLKKGDDCEELEMLRAFRDGYLSASPCGMQKISEYYLFAPIIVHAVNASGHAGEEWNRVYKTHIMPCITALKHHKPDECERRYETMMLELERKWLAS